MKNAITIICFLLATPLFSQKHETEIKYRDLMETYSLGEHGSVYMERLNQAITRAHYISQTARPRGNPKIKGVERGRHHRR